MKKSLIKTISDTITEYRIAKKKEKQLLKKVSKKKEKRLLKKISKNKKKNIFLRFFDYLKNLFPKKAEPIDEEEVKRKRFNELVNYDGTFYDEDHTHSLLRARNSINNQPFYSAPKLVDIDNINKHNEVNTDNVNSLGEIISNDYRDSKLKLMSQDGIFNMCRYQADLGKNPKKSELIKKKIIKEML